MVQLQMNHKTPYRPLRPLPPRTQKAAHSLAQAFLELCDDHEPTAFWLYTSFLTRFQVFHPESTQLLDTTATALTSLLNSHQKPLADHLAKLNVDLAVVCQSWFQTLFAGVLPPDCLTGIYDVLIGGAPAILAYTGLSLLLACRRKLESTRSAKEVQDVLDKISNYVDVDAVARTAIDMWERPILEGMPKETRKMLGYNF
ncbi:TBC1 domain member 7 [Rhizophlyctis rosea]|uniref:TBC1 domain family member 7 n=1 Tax=Rhizophlyctis rosea TaxID=64517 RepID=A0AAD5SJT7_9FUNG|nr:TBC1 domain member 7 [Rhizophlyctis rosea]